MSLSAPKSKGLNKKVDIEALSESALMNLLAKESRAKARARARARTKEKRHGYCTTTATTATTSSYSINKRSHKVEKCGLSAQISNQFGTRVVPVEELDQDRSIRRISPNSGLRDQDQDQDQDQGKAEPDQDVMIKRKFRFPYSISISGYNVDHHQGQFSGISKCEASNNVVYSCPSLLLTQNWDNHSNSNRNSNNNNNNNNNVTTASLHPSFCLPT